MGRRIYSDIEYDGKIFATAQELAAYVGLAPQTVLGAIKSGRLDNLGVGRGRAWAMPVRIAGRDFSTAAEAGAYFGCSKQRIYAAINAGEPERVLFRKAGPRATPLRLGPLTFPSYTVASLALGFSRQYVWQALRAGQGHRREKIMAAAWRLHRAVDAGLSFDRLCLAMRGGDTPEAQLARVAMAGALSADKAVIAAEARLSPEDVVLHLQQARALGILPPETAASAPARERRAA